MGRLGIPEVIYTIHTTDDRGAFLKEFLLLPLNKSWDVEVRKHKTKRSLDQNALLHKWFHIIASDTGNDPEDVKNALKDKYLPLKAVTIGKKTRYIRTGTSELDVAAMSEFMDRVMAFAATELGIQLPTSEDR